MNSIKAKLKEAGRKSAKQITILIIAMTATRNHFSLLSPLPAIKLNRFDRSMDRTAANCRKTTGRRVSKFWGRLGQKGILLRGNDLRPQKVRTSERTKWKWRASRGTYQ